MNPSPTQNPEIQAVRNRLDRMEQFLRSDPNNPTLLADAFETALSCREFERAEFHLRHAQAMDVDPWGWRLKEGDLLLAQKHYDQAQAVLLSLLADPAVPADLALVLQHNLAYIDLQRGAFEACVQRLAPLMEAFSVESPTSGVLVQALQVLWLRALHRTGKLSLSVDWAHKTDMAGQLSAQAAGVASLIALDANDMQAARRWSQLALSQATAEDRPLEALNAQASLQLGDSNPAQARQFAMTALQLQPEDGRSWSVLAFADMLAGDLNAANQHFTRSLATMPEHIGTWHGLGWTQLLHQRLDEAQATFEKALDMDRNFAESHGGLAVVLALKQQKDSAQSHIDRALGLDKTCLSAQYAQAILKGETQDLARFQRMVQRLLGGRPSGLGDSMLDRIRTNQTAKK
jgi:tetratricopeptide (TPR) repeat protein